MKNISELEIEVTRELAAPLKEILQRFDYRLPDHFQIHVSLLDANGRKKRSTAAASKWAPESGRIQIRFEAAVEEKKQVSASASPAVSSPVPAQARQFAPNPHPPSGTLHPAEADLLKALDRAESRPGWNFVPLKKFRDELLPMEHFESMRTDVEQRDVLRSVIDKKFVLVGKVPNPKSPEFPVTTIRLNRLMPEVKAVLGHNSSSDLDFHPVKIFGEPLSSTVLRDRR